MSPVNRLLPILAGALAGGAIALVVAGGSTSSHTTTTTTVVGASRSPAIPASFSSPRGLTVNQIYRAVSPGVVDIRVTSTTNAGGLDPFGGGGGTQQTQGEGAGVVYDAQGDILTDEHVVSTATSVVVRFQDGRRATARVLGTDPSTDVAVIRVNVPSSELHPVPFADSSATQVGDGVVAIGSPFSLPETVTTGIVSAVDRSITAPNTFTIPGAIQTDAAINPGNSGGPLLDASGHVLGLNDQIQTQSGSSAGVGFAVPANTAKRIAEQIIAGHTVKHSYVGVHLDGASIGGASVSGVAAGSPAASAGLQHGDLITAIDGKAIGSTDQFISAVDGHGPGETIALTVKRGSQTLQVNLKLGTRPATPSGG